MHGNGAGRDSSKDIPSSLHSSQKLSPQQGITTASLNSSLHSLQMSSSGISTSRGGAAEASPPFPLPSFCALLRKKDNKKKKDKTKTKP